MTGKSGNYQDTSADDFDSLQNRDFADVLEPILDYASSVFPGAGKAGVKFSLAMIGKMRKREFPELVSELPIVATIALRQQIGEKAAILTDNTTALTLAGIISKRKPLVGSSLGGDDLVALFRALNPVVEALSNACKKTLGSSFGTIENVEVSHPEDHHHLMEDLAESLCRATVSVRVDREKSGRLALVLPLTLVESLAVSSTAITEAEIQELEPMELRQEELDELIAQSEKAKKTPTKTPAMPAPASSSEPAPSPSAQNIDLILDIQLKLAARLGQVEMPLGEILKLAPGSVIDIDRFVDEPIELLVNDRLIARGEIVVVQENFGVRITEIVSQKDRIKSLR